MQSTNTPRLSTKVPQQQVVPSKEAKRGKSGEQLHKSLLGQIRATCTRLAIGAFDTQPLHTSLLPCVCSLREHRGLYHADKEHARAWCCAVVFFCSTGRTRSANWEETAANPSIMSHDCGLDARKAVSNASTGSLSCSCPTLCRRTPNSCLSPKPTP